MQITAPSIIQQYYHALLNRDANYIGVFFAAVKTTGIFCISTCRARKPILQNVTFYTYIKEVLDNGFRPCKICQPTQNAYETPADVAKAIAWVKDSPKKRINDQDLREKGITPERLRRWFNRNYGITFQAYQRMYRINLAYQELKEGKTATDTALESGYNSLSGFSYTYKKLIGQSPNLSNVQNLILINRITTPIGPMFVCATDEGVSLLEFVDRRMLETEFKDLQRIFNARIIIGENDHIQQVRQELKEYFDGKRKKFQVKLNTPGTDFQKLVWKTLQTIPFGKTKSYQDQAIAIDNPKAVRAVANANGCNRVAIIIPCHRIIGKNGKMTGYGGCIERKKLLITHEKKFSTQQIGDNYQLDFD